MPDHHQKLAGNHAKAVIALSSLLTRAVSPLQPICVATTSNRVTRDGGRSGPTIADFMIFARVIAAKPHVAHERGRKGGDQLGPQSWSGLHAHLGPDKIATARSSDSPQPRAPALARVQTALRDNFLTGPRT